MKLDNLIENEARKEGGCLGFHNGFHLFVCSKQPEFKVHSRGESYWMSIGALCVRMFTSLIKDIDPRQFYIWHKTSPCELRFKCCSQLPQVCLKSCEKCSMVEKLCHHICVWHHSEPVDAPVCKFLAGILL